VTWNITAASEPGTSHLRRALANDDAHASWCDEAMGTVVLAVADGAGSARRGGAGARIAVEAAVRACRCRLLLVGPEQLDTTGRWRRFLQYVLDVVRYELERSTASTVAEERATEPVDDTSTASRSIELEPAIDVPAVVDDAEPLTHSEPEPFRTSLRDVSTTLLVVVATTSWVACLQVGDGVIVARQREAIEALTRPAKGAFKHQTDFVTMDDYTERVQYRVLSGHEVDAVALMTDGLEHLAVDLADNSPRDGFMQNIFAFAASPDHDPVVYSSALASELRSDRVSRLTSDDKTLLVAARSRVAAPRS